MSLISKFRSLFRKNKLQVRSRDISELKKAFLRLHDSYEGVKYDLNLAQKCSYYALNISNDSKPTEIIFFCHEIATMFSADFKNYNDAIHFFKMGLDYVSLTNYDDQNEDLVYFTSLIGKAYYFSQKYKESLTYYLRAKELIETTNAGKENLETIMNSIESNKEKLSSS